MVEVREMAIFSKIEMFTIRRQNIPRAAMGSGIPDGKKQAQWRDLEAVSWEQPAVHKLKTKKKRHTQNSILLKAHIFFSNKSLVSTFLSTEDDQPIGYTFNIKPN